MLRVGSCTFIILRVVLFTQTKAGVVDDKMLVGVDDLTQLVSLCVGRVLVCSLEVSCGRYPKQISNPIGHFLVQLGTKGSHHERVLIPELELNAKRAHHNSLLALCLGLKELCCFAGVRQSVGSSTLDSCLHKAIEAAFQFHVINTFEPRELLSFLGKGRFSCKGEEVVADDLFVDLHDVPLVQDFHQRFHLLSSVACWAHQPEG